MRLSISVCLFMLMALPPALGAEQAANSLTDARKLGQRLFHRECAVCHAPPLITSKAYASALYNGLVEGREDAVRGMVRKGLPGQMPGFEYGLKPAEIEAIVEYLKTVPKPSPSAQAGESDKRAD